MLPRTRQEADVIDLDALDDVDELRPAKKTRRPGGQDSLAGRGGNNDNEYQRRIEERQRALLNRSLSPDRQGTEPPLPPASRPPDEDTDDFATPQDATAARGRDKSRPMTKIEQQLEKARLQKEKASKQAKADSKIGKKKLGSRLREFEMMQTTVVHWSDKKLEKMTERDWRILREDFEIQVLASGATCPNPMRNWAEGERLGLLPPKVMQAINDSKYKDPSPVQMACIPVGMRRLDLIGLAETGSGKTCAFVIPMVVYVSEQPQMNSVNATAGPYALIMCPTRELARQIEDECYKFCKPYGFRTVSVVGGASYEEQGQDIRRGAEVLVGTPGRIGGLLERHYLVFNQCNYVVLDEADSMVKEGMEEQIVSIFETMPSSNIKPAEVDEEETGKTYRVTVMFSSTMAPELEGIAKQHLRRPVVIKIGLSSPSDIKQTVVVMEEPKDRRPRLVQMIHDALDTPGAPLIIVFCNHRPEVEDISKYLDEANISVSFMHGGLNQYKREAVMSDFHKRSFLVLIATDIIGRGIDVKGVTHVFNYDLPTGDNAIDRYSQRIGRTGRAGMKGDAISFLIPKNDTDIMYALKKKLETENQIVPRELASHEAARFPPGQYANRKRREQIVYART